MYAPRLRLTRQWLATSSLEELVAVIRRVNKKHDSVPVVAIGGRGAAADTSGPGV